MDAERNAPKPAGGATLFRGGTGALRSASMHPTNVIGSVMLVSTFWTILTRWWRTDRIRVSPRDGELFRMTPDAVVIIRGVLFRNVSRRIVSLPGGAAIVYDCDSERKRCQLQVEPAALRRLTLIEGESETVLAEDDLEFFPAPGSDVH